MPWTTTKQVLPGILVVNGNTYADAAAGAETPADNSYRIDHPTPQLGKAR